jgi:hypothetical protein
MKAYTDYPFVELGDVPHTKAPVRECEVLSWDGDKYAKIICGGKKLEVKVGYLYNKPGRLSMASIIDPNKLEVDCEYNA